MVKIIPFDHPVSPVDLESIAQEIRNRPDEDRDIVAVALGKELAPSALSGAVIGSLGGAAAAGAVGALAGLVAGAAAGQALEHLSPSKVQDTKERPNP